MWPCWEKGRGWCLKHTLRHEVETWTALHTQPSNIHTSVSVWRVKKGTVTKCRMLSYFENVSWTPETAEPWIKTLNWVENLFCWTQNNSGRATIFLLAYMSQTRLWTFDPTSPMCLIFILCSFLTSCLSRLLSSGPNGGGEQERRREEGKTSLRKEALNKMRHPSFRAIITRDSSEIWQAERLHHLYVDLL